MIHWSIAAFPLHLSLIKYEENIVLGLEFIISHDSHKKYEAKL